MSDDSFDFDDRWARDLEREPTRQRTPRRTLALDVTGGLRREFMGRHGATCDCPWCREQPETEAALEILRQGGLL